MELTCPKCHGTMRTYERNGVHVDQCADCRGIFLDRGELDRLIDAENAFHESPAPRPENRATPQGAPAAGGLGGVVSEVLRQVQSSGHSSSHSGHGKPYKKKSLMSELFG